MDFAMSAKSRTVRRGSQCSRRSSSCRRPP